MSRELYADIGVVKCEFDQIWEQQQEGYNFVKRFGQSSIEGMYQEFNSAWVAFFKAAFLYLRKEYLLGAQDEEYAKMIAAFERVNSCEWVKKSEISLSAEVIEILSLPLEHLDEKTESIETIEPIPQSAKVSKKPVKPVTGVPKNPDALQSFIRDIQSKLQPQIGQNPISRKPKQAEPEAESAWGFETNEADLTTGGAPKPGPVVDPRGIPGRNPQRPVAKAGENPYGRRSPPVR